MWPLYFLVHFVLAILALRGVRWAYVAFILVGLLYFPAKVGFHLSPRACQLALDLPLARFSLTNYPHIVMFALFFVITSAQFRMDTRWAFLWAGLATLVMGALVEIGEGVTGRGNCRLRDLVPDCAGALLGAAIVFSWHRARAEFRSRYGATSSRSSSSSR
jgi:hypothetical protein